MNATELNSALAQLHILIVETSAVTREMIAFALEQQGALVSSVASVAEAIYSFNEQLPQILVISPPQDEAEYSLLMKALWHYEMKHGVCIPVINLVESEQHDHFNLYSNKEKSQLPIERFQRYIFKPVNTDELITTVKRVYECFRNLSCWAKPPKWQSA